MKETDLYEPCQVLLEDQGFEVKAEVGSCDIMAIKDDYVVIIELKLSISLKLIYQAIDRQKFADKVYVCLPKKATTSNRSSLKSFILLLKRLEIGLIVVDEGVAEVRLETFGFDFKKSIAQAKKKKVKLLNEFALRKTNQNVGGTNGKKMTAYKEKVIEIAKYLEEFGDKSPKYIINYTGIKETPGMLRKNYYGWFLNPRRGSYTLSELGKKDLDSMTKEINDKIKKGEVNL
ncbi:MAG TPA: hypothetical protein DEA45_03770 [Acholeplasmataceae bacterium]|nr:hypothetical protein [Acholeplasmataceae bacterium]